MTELKITINLDGQEFEKLPAEKVEIILNMVNRKVESEAKADDEESFK